MDLMMLQKEIATWTARNFPTATPDEKFLGVVEEVGEWAHARLKRRQKIRGTNEQHLAAEMDAMGDTLVFMLGYSDLMGFDLGKILTDTWDEVKHRDYVANPTNGRPLEERHRIGRMMIGLGIDPKFAEAVVELAGTDREALNLLKKWSTGHADLGVHGIIELELHRRLQQQVPTPYTVTEEPASLSQDGITLIPIHHEMSATCMATGCYMFGPEDVNERATCMKKCRIS